MSKVINVKLSEKGLDDLLNKINKVQIELDKAVKESIKEVAYETNIKIIEEMAKPRPPAGYNAIDTGDLANSTTITTQGNKTIITQKGENAFAVEFGDGEYFYEEPSYPDKSKIPSGVPIHGGGYSYKPKIYSPRWNKEKDPNKYNSAHGQYAVGQMYHGGQYIRENLSKRVQKKGSDALSKI